MEKIPKAIPFVSGILAGANDTGKVSIWRDSNNDIRLLANARRGLITKSSFHIIVDGNSSSFFFKPSRGLAQGDALDGIFASTQPIKAHTSVVIKLVVDGLEKDFGKYDVVTQLLVVHAVEHWSLETISESGSAARQREIAALLKNFKASKNNWPKLRSPKIATVKNLDLPLPEIEFRQRVQGVGVAGDIQGGRFINVGYEHLTLILRIAEVYGAEFQSEFATLDWGVGCGRIARHMPPLLQPGLAGIDVDPVNIEWCQKHLPFGRYETVDPFSRTGFADKTFDLIYSHSVLTHLAEPDQLHWLEELARISRGFMILSVHGLFSAQTSKWAPDPNELWRYLVGGFRNSRRENPDIRDVTPTGYYTDVAQTPAYIHAKWTRFVEIMDIVPGGFGDLHDAVICRPISS